MYALLPYQDALLRSRAPRKLVVKARRIGISWTAALDVACSAAGIDPFRGTMEPKRGIPWRLVSATEAQSRDLLQLVADHLRAMEGHLGVELLDGDPGRERVQLRNGVRVEALAPSARRLRGGQGGLLLDEYASCPFSDDVWQAALPSTRPHIGRPRAYPLVVVSTPLGDTNRFARLALTDEGSSFEQHRVDLHTAIAAGFPEDVDALRADFPDPDMFAQEYECSFLASSMRLVSEETYDAACYARAEWTPDKGAAGFAGYDVARRAAGDYAASVEVLRTGAGLWVPPGGVEQRRGVPFDEQERWIGELLTRCRKVVMDSSGLGMHMHERMHARHGSRVEGVTFTGRSKAELAGALRDAFARRQLHVPIEDTHLRRAVLSIRREVTDAGNERYTAPRSRVAGHADAGWALAMAVWAGSAPEWSGRVLPRVRRTDSAAELIRAMGLGRCAKLYR